MNRQVQNSNKNINEKSTNSNIINKNKSSYGSTNDQQQRSISAIPSRQQSSHGIYSIGQDNTILNDKKDNNEDIDLLQNFTGVPPTARGLYKLNLDGYQQNQIQNKNIYDDDEKRKIDSENSSEINQFLKNQSRNIQTKDNNINRQPQQPVSQTNKRDEESRKIRQMNERHQAAAESNQNLNQRQSQSYQQPSKVNSSRLIDTSIQRSPQLLPYGSDVSGKMLNPERNANNNNISHNSSIMSSQLSTNKYSMNFKPTTTQFSFDANQHLDIKRTPKNIPSADRTPRNPPGQIIENTNQQQQQLKESNNYDRLDETNNYINDKLLEYPQMKREILEQQRALLQKEREILEKEKRLVEQEEELYRSSHKNSSFNNPNNGQTFKSISPISPKEYSKIVSPSYRVNDFQQLTSPEMSDIRLVKVNNLDLGKNNSKTQNANPGEMKENNNQTLNKYSNNNNIKSQQLRDFPSSGQQHKLSDFSIAISPYDEQVKRQTHGGNKTNIRDKQTTSKEDSRQFSPPMKHKSGHTPMHHGQSNLPFSIKQQGSAQVKKPHSDSQSPRENSISSTILIPNELFLAEQDRASVMKGQKHELGIQVSESSISHDRGTIKSFKSQMIQNFPLPKPTRMDQQPNMMHRSVSPASGSNLIAPVNHYSKVNQNINTNNKNPNPSIVPLFYSTEVNQAPNNVVAYPLFIQPKSLILSQARKNCPIIEQKEIFGSRKDSIQLYQQPQQEYVQPIHQQITYSYQEPNKQPQQQQAQQQQPQLSRNPSGTSFHSNKPIFQENNPKRANIQQQPSNSSLPIMENQKQNNEIELVNGGKKQKNPSSFMNQFACFECLADEPEKIIEQKVPERPPAGHSFNQSQPPSRPVSPPTQNIITSAQAIAVPTSANNSVSRHRSPSIFGDNGGVKVSQISMVSTEKYCEKCMEFITADRFNIHTQVCNEQALQMPLQPSLKQIELINQKLLKLAYFVKRKSSMETPLKEINQTSAATLNLHPKLLPYCKYLHECLCSLARDSMKLSQVAQAREDLSLIASRINGIEDSRGFDVFAQKALEIVNIKEKLLTQMLQ